MKTLQKLAILLSVFFFLIALLTLENYGINWDTINHLPRGQAYLNYFLFGKEDYSNLPEWKYYLQKPESLLVDTDIPRNEVPRRSLYQNDSTSFEWFLENDGGGHPPLSDILSSVFNLILFQKLFLINDIDSYRIYSVLLSSALVGLLFYWVGSRYGKFAGLMTALSLAIYPLFWSELHFNNEKDVPETVYWSFMLFSIWFGIVNRKAKWILSSGVFFGLALGTKFNILFIPFVILPWIIGFIFLNRNKNLIDNIKKYLNIFIYGFFALLIGVTIFFVSWPYLWQDPIKNLGTVFGFYQDIGLTTSINPNFAGPLGINTFPLKWIIYTTPLVILFFSFLGLVFSMKNLLKDKTGFLLLVMLWLVVPITRVTWPGTVTYGGIRQIMEFIPAMAILSGIGAYSLSDFISKLWRVKVNNKFISYVVYLIILLAFIPIMFKLILIHPNENVYFNPLIGGLSGAREQNFPFWGNSFGNPYRQGAQWLNHNVPIGAKVAYARELIPNIPRIWLRQDIILNNVNRSGFLRKGEYIIALTFYGTEGTSYHDKYLEKFLNPVYAVKVDNVSILKIWKNDLEHTKPEYLKDELVKRLNVVREENSLKFDFGEEIYLSRIEGHFKENGCAKLDYAYVKVSKDSSDWGRIPGTMPKEDWSVPQLNNQPTKDSMLIPFAAEKARYVDLVISPNDACLFNLENINVHKFNL